MVMLVERRTEAGAAPRGDQPSQRLWRVRAREVILATGALERPLLFAGNDRPGVMLARATRTYLRRFAVLPGRRAVIATSTDDAYLTALALKAAGADVAAVLDARAQAASPIVAAAQARLPVRFDARVKEAIGGPGGLKRVIALVNGRETSFEADLLAASGGFSPVVHLHMHAGGALHWEEGLGAFAPEPRPGRTCVGAAAGHDRLEDRLADGWRAGRAAAERLGFDRPGPEAPTVEPSGPDASRRSPLLGATPGAHPKKVFLDLQNDVTAADADLAWREGYRSVEHLKRYTTLGMATDQGKTSNLLGLGRLAENAGRPIETLGVTTFRPPYAPVTLGALAGPAVGAQAAPLRRLPLFALHVEAGALWQPSGHWMRPRAFPRGAERLESAARREADGVRSAVGVTDVSSLGKFEIAGPDAALFLERVCATRIAHLAPGRGRYTFMLREDGLVFDDGTVWRLDPQRYLLTSSTGGAERMAAHLAYCKDVLSPDLRCRILDVQDHWAGAALAGPRAASLLEALVGAAPPRHMGAGRFALDGTDVLILAASYSGERAFEVYARSFEATPIWRRLLAAAAAAGGGAYGLEALELLRIEKGHIEVGAEIDGRRTPGDLGLQGQLNPKGGFLGWAGLQRSAFLDPGRQALVGLEADAPIPEGAMLIADEKGEVEGHVSSAGTRLLGEGALALGLLSGGDARRGQTLLASSPTRGRTVPVRVVSPHHYDPKGERYRD
jgi:sarcosine oxidase subunit alpha